MSDELRFYHRDPSVGYISNNLLIPKDAVPVESIKSLLRFQIGVKEDIDEFGQPYGRKVADVREMWDETDTHIILPREFFSGVQAPPIKMVREPIEFEHLDYQTHILPRATQHRALSAMADRGAGTINLACGKGKTVTGLLRVASAGVPAIVVVNQQALIYQWMEEVRMVMGDVPVGIIKGKTFDWKDKWVVLATVQTLANLRNDLPVEFRRRFGVAIYDEGHHLSAPWFIRTADLFYGERYSLTATPNRLDGLEKMYQYHLGPIIYKDLVQELEAAFTFYLLGWSATPEQRQDTKDSNNQSHHKKLCIVLGQHEPRNSFINEKIRLDMEAGRQVLVLSHSVEGIERLYQMSKYSTAGLITGKHTKAEDRIPILQRSNPVYGTFDLAREALNKKALDTLHITTLFKSPNDLQQSVGRILRALHGKKPPEVRAYVDPTFSMSVRQSTTLQTYVRALGYPHEMIKENI